MIQKKEMILLVTFFLLTVERMINIHWLLFLLFMVSGVSVYCLIKNYGKNENSKDGFEDDTDPASMDVS